MSDLRIDPETLLARTQASGGSLRALLAQACDWYWETDEAMRYTLVRGAGRGGFDPSLAGWLGKCDWELGSELVQPRTWDEHRARIAARQPFQDLVVRRALEGDAADGLDGAAASYAQLAGTPAYGSAGEFLGYIGIGRDVTEQFEARSALVRLAAIDPLTRLYNRQTFDAHAQQALSNAYAQGRQCAMLSIGLDRFPQLNSVYGLRVGDRMLAAVALRLQDLVRPPHLLGRRGGNEIVALLVNVSGSEPVASIARDIADSISRPATLGQVEVAVTASIGIAVFPRDGGDLDTLLSASDAALFLARRSGDASCASFTPELARRTDLRVRLEQRLRKAYESRDFRLYYQPLVSLPEGNLVGAEALLRWNDGELGDIEPGEFIPIAEESGLIEGLGAWVLREACRQRQLWRQVGLDLPPIAINVSGMQLRNEQFVDSVLATLDEFDVAADELEIEITETGLMDCAQAARVALQRLRDAGIKAALDDFGVGYSSLAHLRDLPMHRLKIDRSFTVECMRDARTLAIVKSVIEMAHNLGLTVTAEGIETPEQQAWMHHLGCDSAQGFYFARPMPAEDFLQRFLDSRR